MAEKKRIGLRKMMTGSLVVLIVLISGIILFLQHPLFGGKIDKKYIEKYSSSQNFKDGTFQNKSFTPAFADGVTFWDVFKDMLFEKSVDTRPEKPFNFEKTNLKELNPEENVLVWFGHSSYYFQLNGLKFLVDPVLTPNAAPVFGSNVAFDGTSLYDFSDIPDIDYLIITHDHYDHLDYTTIKNLKTKTKEIICPLGVSIHFESWGFDMNKIHELDWDDELVLKNNHKIVAKPTRHFSGRTFKRNVTLWASYLIIADDFKLYIGGDSGYDSHFKEIGDTYGPVDLAILENGQYNHKWRLIHLMPEDFVQAAQDLQAKAVLPVHSSKFKLAGHPWYEPLEKVSELHEDAQKKGSKIELLTPQLGEKVNMNLLFSSQFNSWWEKYK